MIRGALATVFAILLLGTTGCSHFNRDWHRRSANSTASDSVEGRWEGTWQSASEHHHAKLRCLMTRETNSLFQARFQATFWGVFKFGYTAHFEMEPHATLGWEFNGEANLGKWAGGMYYYEGRATPTNLVSTYKSKYDHGTFDLRRP